MTTASDGRNTQAKTDADAGGRAGTVFHRHGTAAAGAAGMMLLAGAIDALAVMDAGRPGIRRILGPFHVPVGCDRPWLAASTGTLLAFGPWRDPYPLERWWPATASSGDPRIRMAGDYILACLAAPVTDAAMSELRAWLGPAHPPGSACRECRNGAVVCPRCGGTGWVVSRCPECGHARDEVCSKCAGTGWCRCLSCGGLGAVSIHRPPRRPGMVFGVAVNQELLARAAAMFPRGGRVGVGVVRSLELVFLRRPEMTVAVAGLRCCLFDAPVWPG